MSESTVSEKEATDARHDFFRRAKLREGRGPPNVRNCAEHAEMFVGFVYLIPMYGSCIFRSIFRSILKINRFFAIDFITFFQFCLLFIGYNCEFFIF